jgi:hypothetical protein
MNVIGTETAGNTNEVLTKTLLYLENCVDIHNI